MRLALVCALFVALAGCAPRSRAPVAPPPTLEQRLLGSSWMLENLNGTPVADRSEITIVFPEPGRIAGKVECSRFVGTVEIDGESIVVGPLATSRRRCKKPLGKREAQYMRALSSADRVVLEGRTLLIHSPGIEKPLRFVQG